MKPLRFRLKLFVFCILFSCRTAPELPGTFESVGAKQITPGGVLFEKLNGFIPGNTAGSEQSPLVLDEIRLLQKAASALLKQTETDLPDSLLTAWSELKEQIDLNFGKLPDLELAEWVKLNDLLLKYSGAVCFADELEKIFYNSSAPDVLTEKSLKSVWYTRRYDRIYLNIYSNSVLDFEHTTGGAVRLSQDTDYPYSGSVRVKLEMQDTRYLDLYIRIPGWAEYSSVTVHGVRYPVHAGEYTEVARKWKNGDEIEIEFSLTPVVLRGNAGQFAFLYGPLFLSYPADRGLTISRHPENPVQDLSLVSPSGKMTTFTYSGIPNHTLVLQPLFAETDSALSARTIWLP